MGAKEPHAKYLRKPSREDDIEAAKSRDDHRRETESLRRQVEALRSSNPFGTPSEAEIIAAQERVLVGRYRWGKRGI